MSFHRKYRPHKFADIIGQEHVKVTLQNAVSHGKLSHVYLFTGPRGTGKTSTARILASSILCLDRPSDIAESCMSCDVCKDISAGNMMDLIELDAASHTGVDDIRDLIEKSHFAPSISKNKVYIIDEVHMLSNSAFNALLKTLEEPPEHLYFILATTEVDKVPDTILSRCQRFDFRRITMDDISGKLKRIAKEENIKIDDDAISLISSQSFGGMRNAEVLLDQLSAELSSDISKDQIIKNLGLSADADAEKLLEYINKEDIQSAFSMISEMSDSGISLKNFVKQFLKLIRQKILSPDLKKESLSKYAHIARVFDRASYELKSTFIPELPLELAIVELIHGYTGSSDTAKSPSPKLEKKTSKIEKSLSRSVANDKTEKSKENMDNANISNTDFMPIWRKMMKDENISSRARMAMKFAIPASIDVGSASMSLSSQFYLDQLMDRINISEIEKSYEKLAHKKIKFVFDLNTKRKDLPKSFSPSNDLKKSEPSEPEKGDTDIADIF